LKKGNLIYLAFSSCAIDGEGRYKLREEYFEPCADGYKLVDGENAAVGYVLPATCVNMKQEGINWRNGVSDFVVEVENNIYPWMHRRYADFGCAVCFLLNAILQNFRLTFFENLYPL